MESAKFSTLGSNPIRSRVHNRKAVFEAVHFNGPLGRAEIARLTSLTTTAVGEIVSELSLEGMLKEVGRRRSGRGQPPIQFAINDEGPRTAGVEIMADKFIVVILDLSGQVRDKREVSIGSCADTKLPDLIARTIQSLGFKTPSTGRPLLGIGVSSRETLEKSKRAISPKLTKRLSLLTGVGIFSDREVNVAALGEMMYGVGIKVRRFCYIFVGFELRAALVQDGWILRGASGNAGALGDIVLSPCSMPGPRFSRPLGRALSLQALHSLCAGAGEGELPAVVARLYGDGDANVLSWVNEAAEYLRPAVKMLENILDPETIVVGSHLSPEIIDSIISRITRSSVPHSSDRLRSLPRVVRSKKSEATVAEGAAVLPLISFLSSSANSRY